MKSTVEPLEGNKVKLSIEVDDAEFDKDIDRAFRRLAQEVRLPGFRPGKAPRRVLEARIGIAPAREQALRDGIPTYLAKAVREHDVDLIATPEIEITGGAEDGQVAFDAMCEVRPIVSVPGYGGLRVELPRPEATDEEIQDVIDAERRRHGSLTTVERPAARGDFVTLDMEAVRGDDADPVPGLNVDGFLYEIGRGWVAEGFDDELVGADADDHLTFTLTPSGTQEPADFDVTVTQVQELVLPEISDEWVEENVAEFESVDAWRHAIHERIDSMKTDQARRLLLDRTTTALAGLVDDEPPETMVSQELQTHVENFVKELQGRGISVDQWFSATGQDSNTFLESMRDQARKAVVVDLALRAVADAEDMNVDDDDIESEYARVALRTGMKAKDVRRAYERNDAVFELSAQLRKSKAMDWLLHNVEIVDEAGQPLDREALLGHDHEHDHDDDGLPPDLGAEAEAPENDTGESDEEN